MNESPPAVKRDCPGCGARITVRDNRSGTQRFQCPKCLTVIEPAAADCAAAPTAPAPTARVPNRTSPEPATAPADAPGSGSEPAEPAAAAELERVTAERDTLAARLRQAEDALREAAALIGRIAELEERIGELAGRCVNNAARLIELEDENAQLRKTPIQGLSPKASSPQPGAQAVPPQRI